MQIFFSDFYTIQPALWKNISVQILSSALLNSSLTQLLLVHTNQSSTAYRLDLHKFFGISKKLSRFTEQTTYRSLSLEYA